MSTIWSEEGKLARWLEVELAALDGWAELGTIPAADVATIRANAKVPTAARVAEIELVTDHDLAAFVDAVANYYETDPISRASPTMAECTATYATAAKLAAE